MHIVSFVCQANVFWLQIGALVNVPVIFSVRFIIQFLFQAGCLSLRRLMDEAFSQMLNKYYGFSITINNTITASDTVYIYFLFLSIYWTGIIPL